MDRTVFASLIVLPPVYAVAIILPLFPSDSVGVWVGAGLTIAIGVISVSTNKVIQEIAALLLIALAFLALGGLAGAGTFGGFGIQVANGALIGLPFVVSAYVWRLGEPLLNRIIAFQVTLVLVLMLLATRSALLTQNIAVNGPSFVSAFVTLNLDQVKALGAVVQGLPYPGLPFGQLSDPLFLATAVLAFAGLLLVVVRPQTGRETDLPTTPFLLPEAYAPPGSAVRLLSYSQFDLLQERSRPEGPPDRWLPGAAPLIAAGVVVASGIILAFFVPNAFLLATALAVVGFLFAVAWLVSASRLSASSKTSLEAGGIAQGRGGPRPVAEADREPPASAATTADRV